LFVNGTYNLTHLAGQQWRALAGGVTVTLDLSASPYTLTFVYGAGNAVFTNAGFDCATGATLARLSATGCTWPASLTVTSP
jgi:hypothetical protein